MQNPSFEEIVEQIVAKDSRYKAPADDFVRRALNFTQKRKNIENKRDHFHVTGNDLLDGIREYARNTFGSTALATLNKWGVYLCKDFGEIVFNMVEHDLMAKTDKDSRQDFENGFDFDKAFPKVFFEKRIFLVAGAILLILWIALLLAVSR